MDRWDAYERSSQKQLRGRWAIGNYGSEGTLRLAGEHQSCLAKFPDCWLLGSWTQDLGTSVPHVNILTYVIIIVKIKLPMWALHRYSKNNREDNNSKNYGMDLGELLTVF